MKNTLCSRHDDLNVGRAPCMKSRLERISTTPVVQTEHEFRDGLNMLIATKPRLSGIDTTPEAQMKPKLEAQVKSCQVNSKPVRRAFKYC